MRKIIYHVATTIDGFIAREDGSHDVFPGDINAEHVAEYVASLASYDTVLMGRRTYEVGLQAGVTDPYPHMDSYVFSRTMKESPDPRVHLVADDAVGLVRRLKEQDGKAIYLCGGGDLARVLLDAGLVDEILLKLAPMLLGAGLPLAPGLRQHHALTLISTKVYRTGVVLLQYRVG